VIDLRRKWFLMMLLFANFWIGASVFAQDWSFTSYQVQGNVHMLEPANTNGNIGVLTGADGVLLVDSHFQPAVAEIISEVEKLSDQDIKFVVNTHVHPDHIGGNSLLADYGVTIVAHDLVRMQMLEELRIPRRGGTFFPMPAESARPVLTFSEAISFHLNGEEVRVFHAPPAHTGGDSFVYFTGSDVLHLGDVFRTNMYPIIDHYNGGSFLGMIDAMGLAIGMAGPNTKVIPGHGKGVSDRQGMIDYQNLLFTLRDRVQSHIDEGHSVEEMLAAEPTRDLDPRWGGIPSWTAADLLPIIYIELTR
jgi:cyclase